MFTYRLKKNKIFNEATPDVGKYNPNYDIKFKRSPILIFPPLKSSINEKHLNLEEGTNLNKSLERKDSILNDSHVHIMDDNASSRLSEERNKDHITISPKKSVLVRRSTLQSSISIKKRKSPILKTEVSKDNRTFRFSKYLSRKDESQSITRDIPFLNEHKNEKSKAFISFDKMLDRSFIEKHDNEYRSPGICYYKPKYDLVDHKTDLTVPFKINNNRNNPKFKIQKLWRGFKVPLNYITVKID